MIVCCEQHQGSINTDCQESSCYEMMLLLLLLLLLLFQAMIAAWKRLRPCQASQGIFVMAPSFKVTASSRKESHCFKDEAAILKEGSVDTFTNE